MSDITDRVRELCAVIDMDMVSDVERRTGAPFNGRTLGEIHGELAGTIAGLAGLVAKLADEIDRLEMTGGAA